MNECLPEIEDSNCMIPPSQGVSYRLLNGTGGLYSNKAIHEHLLPSEIERNSNLSTNTQFDASQKHLVESNITTIKQKKILGKINNAISRSSQSSDTDVTEILPIINRGNKNQSTNELHVGRRMLNSKTQILGTNTGIHSQHPLCLNKSIHPLNHSTPAVEGKKTYVSQEHFQHLTPTPGVSTEDTSCLTCELTSTDFDPELVPGHDKKSSSCKRKIPLDKRKRCSKKSHSKPKNNSKDKNSTIINHYNISKTPLTSIDDIIADINKLESNIHASQRCLQSSSYRFQNENKMSKTNNSHSFAELEEEYNCRKENGCNESTNISPSVSDDAGHLNQMMHAHNRLINVYNIVYVDSDTGKDIAASSNLLIGGNMNTSSDKDSSNKNLSGSSVENNAEENIFLMRENANMPNIADVMSSTFHLENNISNSKNFTFNQNLLNGAHNKDNSKIVSHRSTTLSQDANRKTKCNSKPHNVFFNNVVARKLIFQRNSLNSNCQEHDRAKAPESFRSNRNFTYSPELKIKILNTYSTKDFVIHPASQFRVNLGERLAESEVSSFQKDKMAVLNQRQKGACVDFPMPPRQPTNKFFDGITSDHRKSYPNQSEMNHGIDNESFEETRVNNGNTLNNPKIGESIISNPEIIKETGENNVNCASNSANQTDCPRISADGFTTDGSDFHSPDSSDSSSSLESTHSEKSKKNSQQNLAPSVGDWGKASILKPSKFHIYSCDNDSDTSSDDFVCARKRPAPENVTEKSKMPLKRRKKTLFNENKQYFLRSRDSVSANKKVTDEIL
ncbi:probable serine/threonine-protein kinase DDB_G0276461 [Uloborus diversus]|uniref:probable serine/threonine-protein kinase DDB_G0276461 n=1 Tax=Uloborus diversus TaxID=327109 RepID=UPI0024093D3A|nr:probable serine/threonine-protein kinase DDB_G0276461 [Uloborus diversus]